MSDDVTGFVMGALGRTLNDVFAAAGLPEDCDDLDYALEVITGARSKLKAVEDLLSEDKILVCTCDGIDAIVNADDLRKALGWKQ